ncbi:cytochrome P450 [Pyrenochaeta sp. DS3sAY3a]|nr:cytochrome P450 [Pyrenochaeta sp. DS3sAY3a]
MLSHLTFHEQPALLLTVVLPASIVFGYGIWYAVQWYFFIGAYKHWKKLPPGPKSGRFSGTPGYPRVKHHIYFKELADTYGEIYSVWAGPTLQVVLNTPKAIRTLCDSRGAIYNDRPKMYAFHDRIFRGISIVSTGYGDLWRKQRRIFTSLTSITRSKKLLPYQEYESKQYVFDMLKSPDDFFLHTERYGSSVLTSVVYGLRADDITDPAAQGLILMGTWLEANLLPGKYLDDRWPVLQRLPDILAPWRKVYRENAELLDMIARAWWNPAKIRAKNGRSDHCFAMDFLETYTAEGFNEDEAALIALGLMLAGAGTTGAIQNFLIMGCALNPHVVQKAHEELDRIVGRNRLPDLSDEPNLPYVRAIIKETMRWRPFSNQGFYHATTKEDWYDGYYIPAGTTVVANAYSIHFDAKRHPNPEKFDPERFINYPLGANEYANMKDGEKRDHFAYGAGRRICAGLPVAETSLFLLSSRLLWGFNITRRKDEAGNTIPVDTMNYEADEDEDGVFAKPRPYAAKIEVRGPEFAAVISDTFKDAKTDLSSLGEAFRAGEMGSMQSVCDILKNHPDVVPHLPS